MCVSERRRTYLLAAIAAVLAAVVAVVVVMGNRVALRLGPFGPSLRASGGEALPRAGRPGAGGEQLAGTVVDASGTPVADVAITAVPEVGQSPPEVVAYAGGDGAFVLEGLAPGPQRLRVEGAEIFTAEVRYVPVPSDGVRIAVARRVELTGVVVDGGRPVRGAHVTIDGDAIGGRMTATTDAAGGFDFDALPEGSYRVWAHETDLAARAVRVPRLGAGPFPPVTLVLEPATIVVGRVVDRTTGIGVEAAVSVEAVGDPASNEAARFARAGADGVFRIEGVPHGRWLVDAWAPGWISTGALEIQAGRGIPTLELAAGGIVEGTVVDGKGRAVAGATVIAVGEGALGRGLEISARGELDRLRRFSGFAPAPGAPQVGAVSAASDFTRDPRFVPKGELGVLLGPLPFPPPRGASPAKHATIVSAPAVSSADPAPLAADPAYAASYQTDDRGRFRLTGITAGSWTIVATAPGMAAGRSRRLALDLGKVVTGLEVVLTPGTFLVGTVTSTKGGPLAGATVSADGVVAVTDPDGRYRIGPLVGDVVVTASGWGHGDGRAEVALAAPAGDVADEHRQDFALVPADATLRGRIVDADRLPVRGAQVAVTGGAARGRRGRSDDAGWFEIRAVPAGQAAIEVEHPDFPAQRLTIDTAGDATVTLAWGGAVAGTVIDHHTGDPLAGIAVAIEGAGGRREVATGPRGELAIGPLLAGAYTLRVDVPGYLAVEQRVEVGAGGEAGAVTVRDLRVELERGALLAGIVRDRHGARLAGATVTVSRDGGGRAQARTDSEGQFRLRDVPTGDVIVRAEKGALQGSKSVTLRPGDEVLSFQIDLE